MFRLQYLLADSPVVSASSLKCGNLLLVLYTFRVCLRSHLLACVFIVAPKCLLPSIAYIGSVYFLVPLFGLKKSVFESTPQLLANLQYILLVSPAVSSHLQ